MLKGFQSLGVTGAPNLTKAYILNLNPPPASIGHVPCISSAPDSEWDTVAVVGPAVKQAHVLFSATTQGDGVVTYTIWLQVEDGGWRVAAFHVGPSSMAGLSGVDWWEAAKKQRKEGHDLSAALIYATAQNLLYRGPNYTDPALVPVMQDEQSLTLPKELSDKWPVTWAMDGQAFKIAKISLVGTSDRRVVLAIIQMSDFTDNQSADRQNHLLIDAFNDVHPEWREAFDWLAVKSCKPDGSACFGSVYDRKDGYVQRPPK